MTATLLRLVVIAGLAVLLVHQWRNPPLLELPAFGPGAGEPGEVIIQPLPELGPVEAFAVINERPLFLPERRPPAPSADPAPEEEREEFALQGVMILPGGSTAIVRVIGRDESVRLREGETLAGWTVARIEAERVILERGGESQSLPLLRNRSLFQPVPPTGTVNGVVPDADAETADENDPVDESTAAGGRLPPAENGSVPGRVRPGAAHAEAQDDSHDE